MNKVSGSVIANITRHHLRQSFSLYSSNSSHLWKRKFFSFSFVLMMKDISTAMFPCGYGTDIQQVATKTTAGVLWFSLNQLGVMRRALAGNWITMTEQPPDCIICDLSLSTDEGDNEVHHELCCQRRRPSQAPCHCHCNFHIFISRVVESCKLPRPFVSSSAWQSEAENHRV